MKILDRYIVQEISGPFWFGVGTFTILFFSVETLMGVARMVIEAQAGLGLILEYLVRRLPQVLVFVFPMSVLLACLLAFGRLSSDSELTALKACGISFLRIAWPGLVFCFFISLVAWGMNEYLVPPNLRRAYEILFDTQKQDAVQKSLLTSPRVLKNGFEQMTYAHKLDLEEGVMQGVFIHYFFENMRRREVYAAFAKWDPVRKVWLLKNIRTVEYGRNQEPLYEVEAGKGWTAMSPEESPPAPEDLAKRKLRPEEMSRAELTI